MLRLGLCGVQTMTRHLLDCETEIVWWIPLSNSDQILSSIHRNVSANRQRTSTMLQRCLQTLIFVALSSSLESWSQIFQILTHQYRAPAAIFLTPSSSVSMWVTESLCLHSGWTAFWLCVSHKDHFWPDLQPVDGCVRVPPVSANSELMPLLDISQPQREVSFTCLSSASLFPWPTTVSLVLNLGRFFVLLQRSLGSTSGNTSLLQNSSQWETLLMHSDHLVCCCYAHSCRDVQFWMNLLLFHNLAFFSVAVPHPVLFPLRHCFCSSTDLILFCSLARTPFFICMLICYCL